MSRPAARMARHMVALGVLGVGVLSAYHFAARAASTVASLGGAPEVSFFGLDPSMVALGGGYDLAALKNLQRTADFVRQQYYDPTRIDAAAMYRSSLDAVERAVPEALLRLDGSRLQVAVGSYSDTLTVRDIRSTGDAVEELKRVASILDEHLTEGSLSRPEIEYAMINGLLSTLDPHSVFLPPESSKKFQEENEGEFGGLGIQITTDRKSQVLMVDVLLVDTPAERAGLLAGDRIVAIEGDSTMNMDLEEAVSKMRGPPGTPVTITVERDGAGWAQAREFTIVRDRIRANAVWARLLEGNVVYVRIDQFHEKVEAQLNDELTRTRRQADGKLRGVVLDLRDNPGGFLHMAVAVSDRFLSDGVIVSTVGRDGRNREVNEASSDGNELADVPIAVLTSANSASAAEIVAGALKNRERAVIIGERTFGKGSVQNLYPFNDTSRLKLTVARYLTPGDHSIQSVGIPPDIALERAFVLPPDDVEIDDAGVKRTVRSGPRVSLFGRDAVQREADLDGHLLSSEELGAPPVYGLRYLRVPDDTPQKTNRSDVAKDFEVMLARDVLLASRGARRPDVLRDAAQVVQARARTESQKIEQAFSQTGIGIDWSPCANAASADVTMRVVAGADGTLDAGHAETFRIEVANRGAQPICQGAVVVESGNAVLDGSEFYVGRIAPGETRGFDTLVRLPPGYPSEASELALTLQDASRAVLATSRAPVVARAQALPSYTWSWSMSDARGGDGDGLVEIGETIDLAVEVANRGEGQGGVARFLLKRAPETGRAVTITTNQAEFPHLAPGASAKGALSFTVGEAPADGQIALDLALIDDERYDYASVWRGGIADALTRRETIRVAVGGPTPSARRTPPTIAISRGPDITVKDASVTVSGTAADDGGVRDVIVYAGDEKVAYEGGGEAGLPTVPFTASAELEEGNNLIFVVVRDNDGLTTTRAFDVFRPPAAAAAK